MPKDYVKTRPRLINEDIYRYIAKNSSLNAKEVREVFDVYKDMLEKIYTSEFIEDDFTVALPNVGHFKLRKYHGRKKGSTYNIPVLCDGEKVGDKKVVLEEDELDSYSIYLKVGKTINTKIKNKRKEYEKHKL